MSIKKQARLAFLFFYVNYTPEGLRVNMNQEENSFLYKDEPTVFTKKDMNALLVYCYNLGTSDITIKVNEAVLCKIHGKIIRVTKRRLTKNEVSQFVTEVSGGEAIIGVLNNGKQHDCSYSIKESRNKLLRFRVNIVAIISEEHTAFEITLRTIDGIPKPIEDMKLEPEILDNICPAKGMVLVTGATGSGKSTLLSSILRMLLEQPQGNRKILTYESPIEFVYDEVDKPSSVISQTEIPRNLPDFTEALRNALRRAPEVILIGEMRDKETIREGVTASMTGHLLYSTLHTNGVADTVRRMVSVFPTEEKNAAAIDILSSIRMIVSQMLVPSTDGKRVALREYLVFNDAIVDHLFRAGVDNLAVETRKILKKFGRPFIVDAKQKFEAGIISAIEYRKIEALSLGNDKDLNIDNTQSLDEQILG